MLRSSRALTFTSANALCRLLSVRLAWVSEWIRLVVTLPATAAVPAPAPDTAAVRTRLRLAASMLSALAPPSVALSTTARVRPPMSLTLLAAPMPAVPPADSAPPNE